MADSSQYEPSRTRRGGRGVLQGQRETMPYPAHREFLGYRERVYGGATRSRRARGWSAAVRGAGWCGVVFFCSCEVSIAPPPMIPPTTARPAGRDFSSAPLLPLTSGAVERFTGMLTSSGAHVYDLGEVRPGDRITVSVGAALGGRLDPTVAIFDADHDLFAVNDDVDFLGGRLDARIDEVVRHASVHFYLGIAPSAYSQGGGGYTAEVTLTQAGPPVGVSRQRLLLNFVGGAAVEIRNVGTFNIPPFDAGRIDAAYEGETEEIRDQIVAVVRAKYAAFDVEVLASTEDAPVDEARVSTIYFGAASRTVFGISEQVDTWNRDCCDDGIVYTDGFDNSFSNRPSSALIAVAIGQVAAHEAGHLLGLSHVADVVDLMDTSGVSSTLLREQVFKRSILDRSVFPLGFQDGPKYLRATVGASAN